MVVHPDSGRISRVRPYSGTLYCASVFRRRGSHPLWPPVPGTFAYTKDVRYRGPTTPAPRYARGKLKKQIPRYKKGSAIYDPCILFLVSYFFRPERSEGRVWAVPCSLATTKGISYDFFSSVT